MSGPLSGLKVVDFTRVLAGPYCTKLLCDLGANVIKIEPPAGDVARISAPLLGAMSLYFAQLNAGKRNLSVDLNWAEARDIVRDLCRDADIVVENFRPGTLDRFRLGYADLCAVNPRIIFASLSGYGQHTSWRNRPAFAPTVQAETGLTDTLRRHFGEDLTVSRNDAYSHADVYTGLQGVVGILAALHRREQTGEGQHVDVAMAATMLSVNERASAQMADIDTDGEPIALAAPDSHIFDLPDGRELTIASSPVFTPIFIRYCAMMRRNDLRTDARFKTPHDRRRNLKVLLAEVRSWILTFTDIDQLEVQVSEAGLAVGIVRTTRDLADSEWAREWGAVVAVDDRSGGTFRAPGPPWHFSASSLPENSGPAFQGEHNQEILGEQGLDDNRILDLKERHIILSRTDPIGQYD